MKIDENIEIAMSLESAIEHFNYVAGVVYKENSDEDSYLIPLVTGGYYVADCIKLDKSHLDKLEKGETLDPEDFDIDPIRREYVSEAVAYHPEFALAVANVHGRSVADIQISKKPLRHKR